MTKIFIGLPSSGVTKTDCAMCLMDIARQLTKDGIEFERGRAFSTVDEARNMIVDDFLKTDCTHLLFVDWDATFPAHSVKNLLEADKDIIGVNAAKHHSGKPVVEFTRDGKPINFITSKMDIVTNIGMHLTLIKRKVFETVPWPWFIRDPIYDQRLLGGEDFYLCRKAYQHFGIDTWVHNHLSIEIGHIDNGQEVKTLAPIIQKQLNEYNKKILRAKIKKAKQEAECLLEKDGSKQ